MIDPPKKYTSAHTLPTTFATVVDVHVDFSSIKLGDWLIDVDGHNVFKKSIYEVNASSSPTQLASHASRQWISIERSITDVPESRARYRRCRFRS